MHVRITYLIYIGGYRIRKVMSPYQNSCIFHQEIGEVINFKLAYEYIFVTVSLSCLKKFLAI